MSKYLQNHYAWNEIRNELVPNIYKSIKTTMSAAGETAFTEPGYLDWNVVTVM